MSIRVISLRPRTRLGGIVLAASVLTAGAVLLVVGFTLLIGLLAAGTALGLGALVWRRLTGGTGGALPPAATRPVELDPRLEVHAPADQPPRQLPPDA